MVVARICSRFVRSNRYRTAALCESEHSLQPAENAGLRAKVVEKIKLFLRRH
jgi:hypothetical protein